jgi:flagellar biosynthesis/type III secretory pathway M-ring protein FliF/YscJ
MQQSTTWAQAMTSTVARAQSAAVDIMESLGPIRPEQSGWTTRRTIAVGLAVGFVIVAFYFLYRRRRRRRRPKGEPEPAPDAGRPARPEDGEAPEFYRRLVGGLRAALNGGEAHSYTARELADAVTAQLPDSEADGIREKVETMVRRTEEAAYGGIDVDVSDRRADLELARDLVERLGARPRETGGAP